MTFIAPDIINAVNIIQYTNRLKADVSVYENRFTE